MQLSHVFCKISEDLTILAIVDTKNITEEITLKQCENAQVENKTLMVKITCKQYCVQSIRAV